MNWLLILVALILAGNLIWGFYKGFFRVIYSMVAWILILIFVTVVTPYVSKLLTDYTTIDEKIEAACTEKLHELVLVQDGVPEKDIEFGESDIQIPQIILDKLMPSGETVDQFLEGAGAYKVLAERATALAMKAITYAMVFLLTFVVFHLLAISLDLFSKLPLIGEANRALGLLAGALKGFLLVWLFFAVVAMASTTTWGITLNGLIYESKVLTWLYENNFILHMLMAFLG